MSESNKLHDYAMDIADQALMARRRNDYANADKLFKQSLDLEIAALEAMEKGAYIEPSFSILHRSAATLALDCNDYRLAEKLIAKALSHDPPLEIAEELRDLIEQVHFQRHLALRGVSLDEDEMQMSLAGECVAYGLVNSVEFLQRVEDTSKMLYRIVERRNNQPFRDRGRVKKTVKNDYELFLSVPRASSYAVTMKVGRPTDQLRLPGTSDAGSIVDEFMELMALANKADHEAIERRIPDEAYRTNFVHLAKRIAPDGVNVRIVGFTSLRDGCKSFVEVTRPKSNIVLTEVKKENVGREPKQVLVRGFLKFADATHQVSGLIRIIDADGKEHNVMVPTGMMNDIVKPLWDSEVIISGIQDGKDIKLQDIDPIES